jgi:hypothetical protein
MAHLKNVNSILIDMKEDSIGGWIFLKEELAKFFITPLAILGSQGTAIRHRLQRINCIKEFVRPFDRFFS